MIERVTPTAECAAHIFLRGFEAPIRSQRSLDLTFWRQNGDHSRVPAWWPLYLESIRDATLNQSNQERKWVTRSHNTLSAKPDRNANSVHFPRRSFTYSSPRTQGILTATSSEIIENEQPGNTARDTTSQDHENVSDKTYPVKDSLKLLLSKERRSAPGSRGHVDYQKAWTNFTKTGWKRDHAPAILQLLFDSKEPADLNRALSAFDVIPQSQRLAQDYRTAMEIAIRLNRYPKAIQLIKEALSQKIGEDMFFKFLAHCVKNVLWSTAADLWKEVGRPQSRVLRLAAHDKTSRSPNFAGRFTSFFEQMDDLPLRVVTLSERLYDSDPVLVSRKHDLIDLCKRLCFTIVESQKFMGTITGTGLLSVFSVQRQLDFDSRLHFAALGSINKMSDRGSKSQLAILIYRNFRFLYPDVLVPKWVFGAMIGICSAGNHASKTYLALLQDYKSVHGVPDDLTYSQLMRACADQGESADLQFIFDDFCEHSRPKSISDINPLIRVHAVIGQSEKAQSQFDSLPSKFGFVPDNKTWNALLLSYARSNNSIRAYDIFREMMRSEVQPDQYSWTILVSVATKKGDTDRARKILWQAERAGISPPTAMIGALVDSCLLNDQVEEAERIVTEATRMALGDSPTRLWNSLFRYYAFKANSESILRTQKRMKEFNVRPDGMTYAALMTALVVQGRTQEATKILRTLHFSQSLSATQFHYSILIHGFAMETKYEMALLVYQELADRFPRPTLSAKLATLRLTAARAQTLKENASVGQSNPKVELQQLLKSMRKTFDSIEPSDLASKMPNPGFGRKTARNDAETLFLDSLVTFVRRQGTDEAAQDVLTSIARSDNMLLKNIPKMAVSWSSSLNVVSHELELAIKREAWSETDNYWNQILELVLRNCSSPNKDGAFVPDNSSTTTDYVDSGRSDVTVEFKDMIPQQSIVNHLHAAEVKVLPAHRFVLSRQISQYILGLDKRNSHQQLVDWIPRLHEYGFELSSKNWNSLLQALCRSTNLKHRLMAFELFEKYMLPNTPSWSVIRRGKWVAPSDESLNTKSSMLKANRQSRKLLEKTAPDLLMPTYYTMVHLAMALVRSTRTKFADGAIFMDSLRKDAPRTLRLVRDTPYLRDRPQGVLLRGRQVMGDLTRRPRQSKISEAFAGIKNSQAALDNVPSEVRDMIEKVIAPRDDIRRLLKDLPPRVYHSLSASEIEKTKEYLGDTIASPIFLSGKGRLETQEEADRRARYENRRKTAMLQNVVMDAQSRLPLVGTASRGDPQSGAITLSPPLDLVPPSTLSSREQRLAIFKNLSHAINRISRRTINEFGMRSARVSKIISPSSQLTERRRSRIQLKNPSGQGPRHLVKRSFTKNKAYRTIRMTKRARKTRVRLKRLMIRSSKPLEITVKKQ